MFKKKLKNNKNFSGEEEGELKMVQLFYRPNNNISFFRISVPKKITSLIFIKPHF